MKRLSSNNLVSGFRLFKSGMEEEARKRISKEITKQKAMALQSGAISFFT